MHFFLAYARTRRLRLLFASRYLDFELRRPRETPLRSSPPLRLRALPTLSTSAQVLSRAHRGVPKDHTALISQTPKLWLTTLRTRSVHAPLRRLPKLSPCHRSRLRLDPAHSTLFGSATAGPHGSPVPLRCVTLSCHLFRIFNPHKAETSVDSTAASRQTPTAQTHSRVMATSADGSDPRHGEVEPRSDLAKRFRAGEQSNTLRYSRDCRRR